MKKKKYNAPIKQKKEKKLLPQNITLYEEKEEDATMSPEEKNTQE